jgi:starch synthase
VRIGFDVPLAHRITAGADIFLMPSRFEPCGLHQMYAMAYGTPPVARAVGGLRDTIEDPGDEGLLAGKGTGFLFDEASPEALGRALGRALQLWRSSPTGWERLQRAGMERDHSWTHPARRYLALYQRLLTLPRSPP